MKFPSVFINHGGGPLPLLGRQPALVENMKQVVSEFLPQEDPKAIVVISAHWESDPIKITSAAHPKMYYDYYGFPPETYQYQYPAPGSPALAQRIQDLLGQNNLESQLDETRGYDHGVFIPLMVMYPKANIPVVCVSLHESLDATINMQIGQSLAPLREEGILILGSGYTFHNMKAFFNPSKETVNASSSFNQWLKDAILGSQDSPGKYLEKLKDWAKAPGGRICHPREEHLLPLLVAAAAGGNDAQPKLIYDTSNPASQDPFDQVSEHVVSGYLFN